MVGKNNSKQQSKPLLKDWRRTKIIATIGPSCDSFDLVKELIQSGANGLRLNFSHGDLEERSKQIKWIRQAAKELLRPVSVIQDLQGPKIRLGDFDGVIEVKKGQTISFGYNANYVKTGHIPTQYDLSAKLKRGERILLFDGRVHTLVTAIKNKIVYVEALNDGILIKRKGINVPDTDFGGDVITPKDRADLIYGSNQDIDYVALSFVQSAEDIGALRRLLKNMNYDAKIIAKIETKAALDNLEDIVMAADMVMIARGDLAVEVAAESIPMVQRQIIDFGQRHATPTIVATQMLISMTTELEPTRAEVSDVATGVLLGADCLMLSDETASGNHPIEAVKTMQRIIRYTEIHSHLSSSSGALKDRTMQLAISEAIVNLAQAINAKAIVAETKSGATAINVASQRTAVPTIAVTSDDRTANQLATVFGIEAYVRPVDKRAANKLTDWLRENKVFSKGDIVVTASGKYPGVVGTTDTIKVRMLE